MKKGTLIFFCGKMGAGKSTKAQQIAREKQAILISEDEWLAALYPNMIHSLKDYRIHAERLKSQLKPLLRDILQSGRDVVMDYPANTQAQRRWFKALIDEAQARHELVYIDRSDAVCLAQIAERRATQPERSATDTVEMFEQVTQYFEAPDVEEGFIVLEG